MPMRQSLPPREIARGPHGYRQGDRENADRARRSGSPAVTMPRISIVTPSFNQAPYLEQAMTSVLGQGYGDLEYFVMDGGSADGSVDIIRRHEARLARW